MVWKVRKTDNERRNRCYYAEMNKLALQRRQEKPFSKTHLQFLYMELVSLYPLHQLIHPVLLLQYINDKEWRQNKNVAYTVHSYSLHHSQRIPGFKCKQTYYCNTVSKAKSDEPLFWKMLSSSHLYQAFSSCFQHAVTQFQTQTGQFVTWAWQCIPTAILSFLPFLAVQDQPLPPNQALQQLLNNNEKDRNAAIEQQCTTLKFYSQKKI